MSASLSQLPDVLTIGEVARALRIGRNQAYALVASGELPSIRVGRSIRVTKASVLIFLDPSGYARELQERMNPGSTRVHGHGMTPDELLDHLGGGNPAS